MPLANESETFTMFILDRCFKFAEQSGRKKAAAGWRKIGRGNSRRKPQDYPKLH